MTRRRVRWLEGAVLLALLAVAALTRLPGLAERGQWDADQGTDMRVLRAMAVDGDVPLLGPRTSIGSFHHGAAYYYLLAPAAIASAADPTTVTGEIALFGIAAVAAIWWLARLAGGPLAAAVAGLLAAVSPAGIDESTFIWNPNLIPVAAAVAYAAAIHARRTGRARWWVLSGVGAMVTMQCHVLGAVIVVPLAWAWASDHLRRRRTGAATRGSVRGLAGALVVVAAGYLPLLASELGTGFSETRAILDYVGGGGATAAAGMVGRVAMVALRSLTWPVAGLVTDRVALSLLVALVVTLLGAVAVLGRRRGSADGVDTAVDGTTEAGPARWLAAAFGVSVVALAIAAPSLATIVPGLPNDHYHAFLDPIVLAIAGAGIARLAVAIPGGRGGALAAGGAIALLAGIAVAAWPPAVSPDGGWAVADAAAARVRQTTGDEPLTLVGLPVFKNDNALRFPLERRGASVEPAAAADRSGGTDVLVLVCDPLFDAATGVACGGPAEAAWLADFGEAGLGLIDRFEAGPRRVISVYRMPAPS